MDRERKTREVAVVGELADVKVGEGGPWPFERLRSSAAKAAIGSLRAGCVGGGSAGSSESGRGGVRLGERGRGADCGTAVTVFDRESVA